MKILQGKGVNELFGLGMSHLDECGVLEESRAGTVLVSPTPVVSVYEDPRQRVMLHKSRDANPFFHLYEAVWMLSGSSDARLLDKFVSDFSSRFAEPDGHQHGAYGHRWRNNFVFDQLDTVVDLLNNNPRDRRVVIQMWDTNRDLGADVKDVPCNTAVYVRNNNGKIDITVTCRSNDAIWGAYGSNVVHFSILQEYLAARLNLEIGTYYQLSNNFHAYTDVLDRRGDASQITPAYPNPLPMFNAPDEIDRDVNRFISGARTKFMNSWFGDTLIPMMDAHGMYKNRGKEHAIPVLEDVEAPDWRLGARIWLENRK